MKLIVDLRIPNTNPHTLWYATEWLLSYAHRYKEVEICYLGYDRTLYDERLSDFHHMLFSYEKSFINRWRNNRILKDLSGEIVLSFSESKVDIPNIPTIQHIQGMGNTLSHAHKGQIKHSDSYIVESGAKKKELVERFHIEEPTIANLGYWIPDIMDQPTQEKNPSNIGVQGPYIIHDAGWGGETQLEKLIDFWYTHHPRYKLVLLSETNDGYEKYRDIIRKTGLLEEVKIMGLLSEEGLDSIYRNASGWIFIGYHYTGETSLLRALTHKVPLILSNLEDFEMIGCKKINPRRLTLEDDFLDGLMHGKVPGKTSLDILDSYHQLFGENLKKKNK